MPQVRKQLKFTEQQQELIDEESRAKLSPAEAERQKSCERWNQEIRRKLCSADPQVRSDWLSLVFSNILTQVQDAGTEQAKPLEGFEDVVKQFIESLGNNRIQDWFPHWFEKSDYDCESEDRTRTELSDCSTTRVGSFSTQPIAARTCLICKDAAFENQNLLSHDLDEETIDLIADHSELDAHFIQYVDACPVSVKVKLLHAERAKRFAAVRSKLCAAGFAHRILEPLALIPVPSRPDASFALFHLVRGVVSLADWIKALNGDKQPAMVERRRLLKDKTDEVISLPSFLPPSLAPSLPPSLPPSLSHNYTQ